MSNIKKTTATKEDGKTALVPKLRFPEFRDAAGWVLKEVGEVFQVTRGDVLSMGLVQDEKTDVMLYPVYSSQTKNNGLSGYYSDYLFEDAITWTTDGANAGDVNYRKGKFFCTNVCGVLLNSKGFANPCVAALINRVSAQYVSYVGNPKLMNGVMSKIPIPFPPIPEQQKIAECLSSVDELMAAQARKLVALKTHKKGLMQQLFPREGETQPRLRFPEFQDSGEWVPDTLENLCSAKISYGIVQAGPHVPNGMPYIKSTDLNSPLCLASLSRTSDVIAEKYRRSEVVPGDLVFSLRGNIGVSQIVPREVSVANLTQGTARIRTKGPSAFYLHALRSDSVHGRIMAVSKGSTLQEISLGSLREIKLFQPEIDEQQRIADCFTSLDELITAEAQKLEALKAHKKGLMQQLFPSPVEVEA